MNPFKIKFEQNKIYSSLDNKSAVFISDNPSQNDFHLKVGVTSDNIFTLPGTNNGKNANPFTITIDFEGLLSQSEVKALVIPDPYWKLELASDQITVNLILQQDLMVSDAFSIKFDNLTVSRKTQPMYPIGIQVIHSPASPSSFFNIKNVFILNPPAAVPKPLPVSLHWIPDVESIVTHFDANNELTKQTVPDHSGEVYCSNNTDSPIFNVLGFLLSNDRVDSNGNPVPLINATAEKTPSFLLHWKLAPDDAQDPEILKEALTRISKGKDIKVFLSNDSWYVITDQETLFQTIKPTNSNKALLDVGETLSIFPHKIFTDLTPYITKLYLQYLDVPGFDDGYLTLPLQKALSSAKVLSFESNTLEVVNRQSIDLNWKTRNAEYVELSITIGNKGTSYNSIDHKDQIAVNQSKFTYANITDSPVTFTLKAFQGDKYDQKTIVATVFTTELKSFTSDFDPQNPKKPKEKIILSWDTIYASSKTLLANGTPLPGIVSPFPDKGTLEVFPQIDTVYTLNIEGYPTTLSKVVPIKVQKPELTIEAAVVVYASCEVSDQTSNIYFFIKYRTRFCTKASVEARYASGYFDRFYNADTFFECLIGADNDKRRSVLNAIENNNETLNEEDYARGDNFEEANRQQLLSYGAVGMKYHLSDYDNSHPKPLSPTDTIFKLTLDGDGLDQQIIQFTYQDICKLPKFNLLTTSNLYANDYNPKVL
ncbi:hypothetical protein CH352_02440 [Leptospira hartskeerlii]|uniref:Uncharacterized protein n=1 Tax=Leptospira hartskeerlii TaxID=2023177 RepID=A0A2M9XDK9_9LEPT|nr:hypothetical protein [Leptospira hartskeerlii]PJZ25689.1 hypothetical protein CH357_08535 [Leptospira hartskeerlii]PJZ35488.1 hypothetical protein CH352_02440 [Leptospira hartskeerlii]